MTTSPSPPAWCSGQAPTILPPRRSSRRSRDQPEPPPPEPDPPEQESEQDRQDDKDRELAEMVLEAARAAIPKDLLALLAQGGAMRSRQGGPTGAAQANAKRGRPIGVRRGELGGGARLSLLDTLRAAAPWQQIRRVQTPAKPGTRPGAGATISASAGLPSAPEPRRCSLSMPPAPPP